MREHPHNYSSKSVRTLFSRNLSNISPVFQKPQSLDLASREKTPLVQPINLSYRPHGSLLRQKNKNIPNYRRSYFRGGFGGPTLISCTLTCVRSRIRYEFADRIFISMVVQVEKYFIVVASSRFHRVAREKRIRTHLEMRSLVTPSDNSDNQNKGTICS